MYYLSLYIHIIAAIFWIGGMLFTVAVLVPASRHKLLAENRGAFFKLIGEKFSRISWLLFLVLVGTGITNLTSRGFDLALLTKSSFWNVGFGYWLGWKLILFGAVVTISGIHDFYAGPKAASLMQTQAGTPSTQAMRKVSSWLGRANLLLGLAILFFAIRLSRG